MLVFGLAMGALLFVIGLITYVFAPRVGPNPIFGVRVGYSYASREVWDKTNRFGGALFALVGLGLAALALLLQVLGLTSPNYMSVLTVVMIVALLGATAWMFVYARRLAQRTEIAWQVEPVRFRWAYLAPVVLTFLPIVALAVYFYPVLPVERMATHFNLQNEPNGWMARDEFMIGYLGIAALLLLINIAVVFLATREALVALGRWGSTWLLSPERGLIMMGLAFALANLVLLAVLWDVCWFNTRGVHAFPLESLLFLTVPLIAVIVASFFLLARRTPA